MSSNIHQRIVDKLENEIINQEEDLLTSDLLDAADMIPFWDFLNKISVKDRRKLCRMLDVEDGNGGWENFLEEMGLKRWEERMYCRKFPGHVGPTETGLEMLMEQATLERANLSDVLKLFEQMGRLDIISSINWKSLIDLCDKLEGLDVVNFKADSKFKDLLEIPSEKKVCADEECGTDAVTVFVYYAKDAEEDAMFVAERFRSHWKYKVLMITEPKVQAQLLSDPSNSIHKWFLQVDFVVPIVSPQLIQQTQNRERSDSALFNRYIYNLTQHQFVFDYASKNLRCRPLCPRLFITQLQRNPVMQANALLTNYWDTTQTGIDQLATLLPMIRQR